MKPKTAFIISLFEIVATVKSLQIFIDNFSVDSLLVFFLAAFGVSISYTFDSNRLFTFIPAVYQSSPSAMKANRWFLILCVISSSACFFGLVLIILEINIKQILLLLAALNLFREASMTVFLGVFVAKKFD